MHTEAHTHTHTDTHTDIEDTNGTYGIIVRSFVRSYILFPCEPVTDNAFGHGTRATL